VGLLEDYLKPRGVTDRDVIDARGYEEVSDGLKIPLYPVSSAAGDGLPYGYEVRLIPPKITKRDGKETVQKFARPKGQSQQMSINPMFWERPQPGKPLWIVEGTLRADALHERGVNSVLSLTSCWGWRNGKTGTDSQLDELALRGQEVWLWFDGDVTTKREVWLAAHRFAAVLESRGAVIRYGVVPDGLGLDDYLAAGHDVTTLRLLLVDDIPAVEDPAVTEDQFTEGTGLPRTSDAALARAWISVTEDVCHVAGEWFAHVNGKWIKTPGGTAARTRLLPFMERVGLTYQEIGDDSGSTRMRAFGRKTREVLESSAKCASVLSQGLALPEAARDIDHFDRDPWLLNVSNGTLDLRTREFRPHDPRDMITSMAPVIYDPMATAPTWTEFLNASLPDPEVQQYLQRMLGSMLPGMTLSQRVLVFSGRTRAGKGTAIRALFHMLGRDLSGELRREVIMKSARGGADHQTQIMWLKGRRIASVNETNEGEEFDAAKLKTLSGGDEITARGMHQDQQTFKPTHNLILSTNALPNVDSSDLALWGRLRVIPFRQSFLGQEDETLDHKLALESSGLLNWLLDGLTVYRNEGGEGKLPDDVAKAKSDWRDQGDSVSGFAEEVLGQPVPKGRMVGRGDFRLSYERWCDEASMQPVSPTSGKFKTGLEAKGFAEIQLSKSQDPKRPRVWTHPAKWGPITDSEASSSSDALAPGQHRTNHRVGTWPDLRGTGRTGTSQTGSHSAPSITARDIVDLVAKINSARSRRSCSSSGSSGSTQVRPGATSSADTVRPGSRLLDEEAPI
jgi:putative DNA primase/helicase